MRSEGAQRQEDGQSCAHQPDSPLVRPTAAVIFGLAIGLVSSLLGVAGGELIIPTLVFAFGVGIKPAGTASLLISLPTVVVGVFRHRRLGSFTDRSDLTQSAVVGGFFVGLVPAAVLKLVLDVILSTDELLRTPLGRSSSWPRTVGRGNRKAGPLWEGEGQEAPGSTIDRIVVSMTVQAHTPNG